MHAKKSNQTERRAPLLPNQFFLSLLYQYLSAIIKRLGHTSAYEAHDALLRRTETQ